MASSDGLVHWAFLDRVTSKPVRPWLVLAEAPSALGPVRFAVPRLASEVAWRDHDDYQEWEEATWQCETTPIRAVVSVEEAAAALPAGRTRPRWRDPLRLASLALRADLEAMSSTEIVKDDGEDQLLGERARGVRSETQRARRFLAAAGALPWAAFEEGRLPRGAEPWPAREEFARALAHWRRDATNLSWRHSREAGPAPDPERGAASYLLRRPWVASDPRTLTLARAVVAGSAVRFEGSCQEWLEQLISYPHQTAECRSGLVVRAELDGSAKELKQIWSSVRGSSSVGSDPG